MIACNGWLDVLLFTGTRADIIYSAYPPTEDIGLDTFAFMGKGHNFGTITTVEAGQRGARAETALRISTPGGDLD
jgi:hypothetical protein